MGHCDLFCNRPATTSTAGPLEFIIVSAAKDLCRHRLEGLCFNIAKAAATTVDVLRKAAILWVTAICFATVLQLLQQNLTEVRICTVFIFGVIPISWSWRSLLSPVSEVKDKK